MGVIDTLKDFAGDVADDTKEAFDELLDRDHDCWDDPWGRYPRNGSRRNGESRNGDAGDRGSRSHAIRDHRHDGYHHDGYHGFYYYCECYCHSYGDPHPDHRGYRRSPASRPAREVEPAPASRRSALPEGASRASEQPDGAGSDGEPADTAALSTQINDLTETVNALRKSLEQLPRSTTAPQNGANA